MLVSSAERNACLVGRKGTEKALPDVVRRVARKKGRRNLLLRQPLQCRGDWIRTSDLLNPILGVKAASSRRMSQMQAF